MGHRDAASGAALGGLPCSAGPRFALVRGVASASVAVCESGQQTTETLRATVEHRGIGEMGNLSLQPAETQVKIELGWRWARRDGRAGSVEKL